MDAVTCPLGRLSRGRPVSTEGDYVEVNGAEKAASNHLPSSYAEFEDVKRVQVLNT